MESEANWLLSYGLRFCCDPLIRIHSRGQKDLGRICHASQAFNAHNKHSMHIGGWVPSWRVIFSC